MSWDEIKDRWVAELRSGKREQGEGALVSSVYDFATHSRHSKYCCLGVLADMMGDIDEAGDYEGSLLNNMAIEDWSFPNWKIAELLEAAERLYPTKFDGVKNTIANMEKDGAQRVLAVLNDGYFTFEEISNIIEEAL